jgi:sugar O-acyltransferase (sialic acid O-acetyltransferase NeuD family)
MIIFASALIKIYHTMLIAGTGGLGREILGILIQDDFRDEIVFFDENKQAPELLYDKFRVIKDWDLLKAYFEKGDNRFITGIGNPRLREKITLLIEKHGGEMFSVISKRVSVFHYHEEFIGVIIQPGVGISHNVTIGKGAAIHINSTIGHSAIIGKYVNIGPNVSVIGPVEIGDYSYISAQAIILPNVKIGKNVIVTAGKLVDKNLENFVSF